MKITIIGDVCIDHNKVEKSEYKSFGGPPCYCDIVLRTSPDVETTLITNYGPEFTEYYEFKSLLPEEPNRSKDMIYKNISTNGSRKQYVENPGAPDILIDKQVIKANLNNSDAVIFASIRPYYTQEFLEDIFKDFEGIKVAISQGFLRQFDNEGNVSKKKFDEYKWFLSLFDYATFSDEDYDDPLTHYKKWTNETGCKIIMTSGPEGADLITSEEITNIPTEVIENVIDSTGSGDIFTAAFTYFLLKTGDELESIQKAHKVAGNCLAYTAPELLEQDNLLN